jgi:ribosomal protein L29
MAKEKKFASLSKAEAQKKLVELQSTLVKFRVSADASLLTEKSGVAGLRNDIRALSRIVATKG